jgi:hypothetical protein
MSTDENSNGPTADFLRIIEAARIHYENLKADISNAHTRIEHIRLTALAQEALNLLTELEAFEIGMIYTRIQSLNPTDLEKYMKLKNTIIHEKSELTASASAADDLPEFKSPFTPPPAML